MRLCNSPDELWRLIRANTPPRLIFKDFSADEWLANPDNFALVQGNDLGMFQGVPECPGALLAHVLFETRGRQAIKTAKAMLSVAVGFGAAGIFGEVEADNKAVLWFVRQIGFEPCGEVERRLGKMICVRLRAPSFAGQAVA